MINTINIHNLSQENVSCLNSALVLLMLANKRDKLVDYLVAFKARSDKMRHESDLIHNPLATTMVNSSTQTNGIVASATAAAASSSSSSSSSFSGSSTAINTTSSSTTNLPVDLLTNFKDLLVFWQNHYLHKDKDCAGLEQNSRIDFPYWKYTVELLLDPNTKNKSSLNYYLNNETNYFNSKPNRIDEYRCD
jgi:hypothetical protein